MQTNVGSADEVESLADFQQRAEVTARADRVRSNSAPRWAAKLRRLPRS